MVYEKIKEPEPVYTAAIKLIQLRRKTFERLKQHNRYYHSEDSISNSFDNIITTLMDFYEKNHNKYEIK